MCAKHIIRLDDFSEHMNWENYAKVKHILRSHGIRPLIGVIPDNQDEELLHYPNCPFDLWREMVELQSEQGWSVALHGHQHVFETGDSGVLKINPRSEFAGMPKVRQSEKIQRAKGIFQQRGLNIDAFMAPAHSFDKATLQCLQENGIGVVTDGYGIFPYDQDGLRFVPQLFSRPRKMPFGIFTWCLHINGMSENEISALEKFIKANRGDIISFEEAGNYVVGGVRAKIQSLFIKYPILAFRKVRRKYKGNR